MRRLFWVFGLLASLVWQLAPASAGQRVLLRAEVSPAEAAGTMATRSSGAAGSLRSTALRNGSVRVIVGLRVPFAPSMSLSAGEARQQDAEIAAATAAVRQRFAATMARAPERVRSFANVPFIAMEVTPAELDRLAADPEVISIAPDMVLTASLLESAPLIRAPEAWEAGYTGRGQTVAVIDTGIDKSHPFLTGKVVAEACYTDRACPGGSSSSTASGSARPCSASECDHGTHVAGIAAGRRLSNGLSGIAPDAQIIAIQVFKPVSASKATTNFSDVLKGMERVFALSDSHDIAAVNMSLGSNFTFSSSCDGSMPAMAAMIDQLKAAGIATVVASGNGGVSNGISLPACMSGAVSVGSVSDRNWGTCSGLGIAPAPTATDVVACYSNSAGMLSLLAPGSFITSSVPNAGYEAKHGTSMASPHVAGAFAVMAEKAPAASVSELLTSLRTTGKNVTDYRTGRVTPRIDVKAALDSLADPPDTRTLALTFAGNGRGTVTFTPAGSSASCTASCSNRYETGTVVSLSAAAGTSSSFTGWTGACSGTGTCSVTMSSARQVGAIFEAVSSGPSQTLSLTTTGSGIGAVTITANGVSTSCTGACTRSFGQHTAVTLTAAAASGSMLTSWSGACKGRKSNCVVRMSGAKSVSANFAALPVYSVNYSKAGAADGEIEIAASGSVMRCTADCAPTFPAGTAVRLTAKPAAGKRFGGWSGICRGVKASCSFTLRSPAQVSASFN